MYYQIPALELSWSVPLVLRLQAVFRRAGARVWFMTSCCCPVEFGFSCFNHASIESWFVWYSIWYSALIFYKHNLMMRINILIIIIHCCSTFWGSKCFFQQGCSCDSKVTALICITLPNIYISNKCCWTWKKLSTMFSTLLISIGGNTLKITRVT